MAFERLGMAGWLRIFCATLLLSLGLANKPALARGAPSPAASSEMLPDGSYATICYGNENAHPARAGWLSCEACRLGGDLIVPAPSSDHILLRRTGDVVWLPPRAGFVHAPVARPGSPVRGPPSAFA